MIQDCFYGNLTSFSDPNRDDEGIVWIGHKVILFGHEVVWIRLKSDLGASDLDIFCSKDEEKVGFRREKLMRTIVCVRVENMPN